MRNLVAMLWSEWKDLELQIVQMNDEVERSLRAMLRVGDCGRSLASDRWLQPRIPHLFDSCIWGMYSEFSEFMLPT
jgi:hypothetical protein